MFDHHCDRCAARVLIFPSQVTGLLNTDDGIEVAFTCWCGAECTHVTGRRAPRAEPARTAARAA